MLFFLATQDFYVRKQGCHSRRILPTIHMSVYLSSQITEQTGERDGKTAPAYFASGKKSRRTYAYSPHFAEFSPSEIAGSVRRRLSLRRAGERTWMTDRRRQLKSILPTHPHTVPRARPLQNFKVIMRKRSRRRSSGLIKASSSPIFRYAWEGGTVGTFEEGEEESGKKESRRKETKKVKFMAGRGVI